MLREQYRTVVLALCGSLYILSPFDVVPEAIFGIFGVVDDLCVVIAVVIATGAAFMVLL